MTTYCVNRFYYDNAGKPSQHQWFLNFRVYVKNEVNRRGENWTSCLREGRWLECWQEFLKPYNATINNDRMTLEFESEKDFTLFLLTWS